MESRGVELEKAVEAEMPSWDDLIRGLDERDFVTDLHPDGDSDAGRLEDLRKQTFRTFKVDGEKIRNLFAEHPAGYIHGDLRALTGRIVSEAGKRVAHQMRTVIERTIPEYDEARPLIAINTWGQPVVDESLFWRERRESGRFMRLELRGPSASDPVGRGLHYMFSGVITHQKLSEAPRELEALYALPGLDICGVFQHFAVADSVEPDDERYTDEQHALFAQVVERLRADGCPVGTVHCANSAAQLRHPEWRHDMTRAGIILYGLDPSSEVHFPALQPVMSLKSVVTFVKELQPGQSVSYGRTFTADKPMRVATVCVGYADGYPRMLSGGPDRGVMVIRGQRAPVVGRVCMDQTMVDVTDIPGVKMGDEVTVFGPDGGDTADTIAAKTQTINYEGVCGLARRVPRVYKEYGKICESWNNLEET